MSHNTNESAICRRHFIRLAGLSSAFYVLPALSVFAGISIFGKTYWIHNPTPIHFSEVPVRIGCLFSDLPDEFIVLLNGSEVPWQLEKKEKGYELWVSATVAAHSKLAFELLPGKPLVFSKKVTLQRIGNVYKLQNEHICVHVPALAENGIPGPVGALRLADGKWVGKSIWNTRRKLRHFQADVIGDGTLFAKVRMRYEFDYDIDSKTAEGSFSEIEIMLAPGWKHLAIAEHHQMSRGDHWEWVMSEGWTPIRGISKQFNDGPGGDSGYKVPAADRELLPIQHVSYEPNLFINLIPRWNQHFVDGWSFSATDGQRVLSATAVKASRWKWPHDNRLQVMVDERGTYAGVKCSTFHGERIWWMSNSPEPMEAEYIRKYCWEDLDKINNDYILDWPGRKVEWWSANPYDSEQTNPTQKIRVIGKEAVARAGQPADDTTLIRFQTLIHRDAFGSYWDFFSPENPNFFTDYNLVPIALATNLKAHPKFGMFRKLAEDKFREDLYHSITLPGGAGQEAPGYLQFALSLWSEIAKMGEEHLGFDKSFIDARFQAGEAFYKRISYPDGDYRRGSPVGDSHPDRKNLTGMPLVEVDPEVVKSWKTEEYPGFGVLFSNRVGTSGETYFSFKSGPNRCHYHGDQLAFHYCANARPLIVDHHCSYNPRAGQEHMHNRLAFFTDEMPYANMDGYERVLAFKTSESVDIAVGQVESLRLRQVLQYPPEVWDSRYPILQFDAPLVYRRTVVLVKNGQEDYFVIRDQYAADRSLQAAYCLHTYGNTPRRVQNTFDFSKFQLFVVHDNYAWKNFDWAHENGGREETKGLRIEFSGQTGEIITVLYPGAVAPEMNRMAGGVQVGSDQILFAGSLEEHSVLMKSVQVNRQGKEILSLVGSELNPDRFQGEIGLFVPDAGYPFGEIPDWLIRQRTNKPLWANYK